MSKGFRVVGCVDWSVLILACMVFLMIYFSLGVILSFVTGVEWSSSFQTNQNSGTHRGIVSQ